jgi:hypothetical protein
VVSQQQHVISEWLLKAFARPHGDRLIVAYDKKTGEFTEHDPADFMAEPNAHPSDVEVAISRIETPAAQAARTLLKRAKAYPAGMYAVMEQEDDLRAYGPAFTDRGSFKGTRLMVSEHTVRAPKEAQRSALAIYAALMYQRAPTNEAWMLRWGEMFDRGVRQWLDPRLPGMWSPATTTVAQRRARAVELAVSTGRRLMAGSWFLVKSAPGEAFVLGDTPVVSTTSFGHDDQWRALLDRQAFIVLIPLNPLLALVIAPQHLMPVVATEPSQVVGFINRTMWRAAGRFVLGRSQAQLEGVMANVEPDQLRTSLVPTLDAAAIEAKGAATAFHAAVRLRIIRPLVESWLHWEGCRLRFGNSPFDSAANDGEAIERSLAAADLRGRLG